MRILPCAARFAPNMTMSCTCSLRAQRKSLPQTCRSPPFRRPSRSAFHASSSSLWRASRPGGVNRGKPSTYCACCCSTIRSMLRHGWHWAKRISSSICLEEGVQALQMATRYDPTNQAIAVRLAHAREALAGKVCLKLEPSPEEELLRAERRRRWHVTTGILLVGLAVMLHALLSSRVRVLSALDVPWSTVAELRARCFSCVPARRMGDGSSRSNR